MGESNRALPSGSSSLRFALVLVFGLTLLNTWSDVIGHASAFASSAALLQAPLANGRMLFSSGLCISSFAAAILYAGAQRRRHLIDVISTVVSVAASVTYAFAPSLGEGAAAAAAAGAFLVGAGYGWLEVRLVSLAVRGGLGSRAAIWALSASLLLKTAVTGIVGILPNVAQIICLASAPLLAMACSVLPLDRRAPQDLGPQKAVHDAEEGRAWVCFLVLGAVLSAVARALSNLGYWGGSNLVGAPTLAYALFAAPVFLAAVWYTFDRGSVKHAGGLVSGFLMLLAGFLLLELFGAWEASDQVASVLTLVVELYGHALFWALMVLTMERLAMHPFRVVGVAEGIMSASAILLAALVAGVAGVGRVLVALSIYVAATAVFLLFKRLGKAHWDPTPGEEEPIVSPLAFMGVESGDTMGIPAHQTAHVLSDVPRVTGSLVGPVGPVGPADQARPAETATIEGIFGLETLSEREREVFELLAQGRDRAFIAQKLCLSEGTVKTHMQHIYAKLGIHSKQELISLVREASDA